MLDKSCKDFNDVLASKAAVPGGGGAAAMGGAIGMALSNMVGNLTVGKKKYADVEEETKELIENVSKEIDEDEQEATYILDIKESSKKSTSGEEVFEVSYTTKGTLTKDELGPETAFGLWGSYGISLNMLVINPAYAFFFSQMDLKVGEKMNFFGAGIIKVIGKEKIAGREGFVCQLFQADEEEKMIAEWIIEPDLALPLRSKIFEDNELQGQIELVKYMQY